MKDNKATIILFFIGILFVLLCFCILLLGMSKKGQTEETFSVPDNSNTTGVGYNGNNNEAPEVDTIEKVLARNNVVLLSKNGTTLNVQFPVDLFDDDNKSNQEYFYSLIYELTKFFEEKDFTLIDESKAIRIQAIYDEATKEHRIIINDNEDFYKNVKGSVYIGVQNVEPVESQPFYVESRMVKELDMTNYNFNRLSEQLGDNYEELDSGYRYYPDQDIEILLQPNKAVLNIVLGSDYKENILTQVDRNATLKEIAEAYPNYFAGGPSEGYLAYTNWGNYIFFYKDEVSIYSFNPDTYRKFDPLLNEYLESKNFDSFVRKMKNEIRSYASCEIDFDHQDAMILYPTRGFKVEIHGNDPSTITLYNNYTFTEETKQLVKDGKITYVNKDSVEVFENERRNR